MPEPTAHPHTLRLRRVALTALIVGAVVMVLKFGVFLMTSSAAVLTDALESIINIVAAAVMLYSVWLAGRPADRDHPYGHGKVEFMALGFEGGMILTAGLVIAFVSVQRLVQPVALHSLDLGGWLLLGINGINAALALGLYLAGRRYGSLVLVADAKHLATDAASTLAVVVGLLAVHVTGLQWIDPLLALGLAALILATSGRLLRQSAQGLMDYSDPSDQAAIAAILDDELHAGHIRGYHKVRHRHTGDFTWVDLHLQVDPGLDVRAAHALASRIEYRVERHFGGRAKATAHVEPHEPAGAAAAPASAPGAPG